MCIRLANSSLIFVDLKFAKLFPMQKSLMIRKPALENRPTNILNCLDNHEVGRWLYNFVVNKNHNVTFYDIVFVQYLNVKRENSNLSISCFQERVLRTICFMIHNFFRKSEKPHSSLKIFAWTFVFIVISKLLSFIYYVPKEQRRT